MSAPCSIVARRLGFAHYWVVSRQGRRPIIVAGCDTQELLGWLAGVLR